MTVTNSFHPGAFPEYRLACTGGECTAVKANCTNSFVEFGVVCKTQSTSMGVTTQMPITISTPLQSKNRTYNVLTIQPPSLLPLFLLSYKWLQ